MGQRDKALSIETPCQQKWASMTEAGVGRFCAHCARTVVDFTQSTDDEILETISKNTGKICGRLSSHQLNRQLVQGRQSTRSSHLYRLLAGLFVISMADNAAATSVRTEPEIIATNNSWDQVEPRLKSEERATQSSDSLKNTIQGTIIDGELKNPLPAVWIGIRDTKISTTTNSDGKFSLVVPDDLTTPTITIVVKYIGYTTSEISFKRADFPITRDFITISPAQFWLGEVIVVDKKKSGKKQ